MECRQVSFTCKDHRYQLGIAGQQWVSCLSAGPRVVQYDKRVLIHINASALPLRKAFEREAGDFWTGSGLNCMIYDIGIRLQA